MKNIIYILILIGTISCSKDDDNDYIIETAPININKGKVKSETITESSLVVHTLNYEYNSNGKLSKYTNTYINGSSYKTEFTQNNNKLSIKYYRNSVFQSQYTVDLNSIGNIISEIRNDGVDSIPFWYEYNSDGYLTDLYENWQKSNDTSTYYHTQFAVFNGNVSTQFHTSGIIYNYEYFDEFDNTQEIYQIKRRSMGGLLLYPRYYGQPNKKLLKYDIALGDTIKYEYFFDSDGRVNKEIAQIGQTLAHETTYTYY